MNIKAVAADIKTFQRLSREGGGLGGGGAAAAAGMEVTADTPREEKQRQYGLKGPAHPAEVGRQGRPTDEAAAWGWPRVDLAVFLNHQLFAQPAGHLVAWGCLACVASSATLLGRQAGSAWGRSVLSPPAFFHLSVAGALLLPRRHAGGPGAGAGRLLLPARRAARAAGAHALHVWWVDSEFVGCGSRCLQPRWMQPGCRAACLGSWPRSWLRLANPAPAPACHVSARRSAERGDLQPALPNARRPLLCVHNEGQPLLSMWRLPGALPRGFSSSLACRLPQSLHPAAMASFVIPWSSAC